MAARRKKRTTKKTAKKRTVKRAKKGTSPMAHLAKAVKSQGVRIEAIESRINRGGSKRKGHHNSMTEDALINLYG